MAEITRSGSARWQGDLKGGTGVVSTASGAVREAPYSFASRFADAPATNPEELIAGAHAACYAMALSNILASGGHPPQEVRATVTLRMRMDPAGPSIVAAHLECEAQVAGLSAEEFQVATEQAKEGCPVSRLLRPGLESLTLVSRLV